MNAPTIALEKVTREARIIRDHYRLTRAVTPREVREERANLQRRADAGSLDTRQQDLAARLGIAPHG